MKRLAAIFLIAASLNYVVLVVSIRRFHDKRSVYNSIRLGDSGSSAFPILRDYFDCDSSGEDRQSTICKTDDFWHAYRIVVKKGVVVGKNYHHQTDIFRSNSEPRPMSTSFLWTLAGIAILLFGSIVASFWYLFKGSKKITISKWWYTFSLGLSDSPMSLRIRWLVGVTGVISIPVSLLLGFAFGLVIPLLLTVGAVMVGRWKRTGRGIISGADVFVSVLMIPFAIGTLLEPGSATFVGVAIEVAGVAWLLLVIFCDVVLVKEARIQRKRHERSLSVIFPDSK